MIGLLLAGGVLLLWVCWKMWRELREQAGRMRTSSRSAMAAEQRCSGRPKDLRQAAVQIVVADVSMSLDNVLAVAGAAREHPYIAGLRPVAVGRADGRRRRLARRVLQKQRWIAYVGLAIILYVAFEMIYRGSLELAPVIAKSLRRRLSIIRSDQ